MNLATSAQPRHITALEHDPVPVKEVESDEALSLAEADYLQQVGKLRPGFCDRGHRSIRLAQYCGLVSTGSRILEILPKTHASSGPEQCRGLLLRLLRATDRFPLFRHLPVGQHLRRASLIEVFIAAFLDATTQIIRGGLLRQYRELEDDLGVVRGRIHTARQFAKHSNRPDRIACHFDELTPDNEWNRLVKAALHAVRPWIRNPELSRRWVELTAVFEEVNASHTSAMDLEGLVFDRHARRYRNVMDWVRWILSLLSPQLRAGPKSSPALLFDMNLLFQAVVASHFRRLAAGTPDVHVSSQESSFHLASLEGMHHATEFELRPDLVVRKQGVLSVVFDTKWKRVDVRSGMHLIPSAADAYQMLAYAAALKCKEVALIYPWFSGLTGSLESAFELARVGEFAPRLSIVCLDLDSDRFEVMRGLDVVKIAGLCQLARARSRSSAVPGS